MGGNIQIIREMNHAAMPLHFTLMFPLGTKGWHPDLKQIEGNNKRLTCREFTVFHMNWHSEDDDVNYIHFGSHLFQEWIVIVDIVNIIILAAPIHMEHCEFSAGQALIVAFNLLQIRMPSFGAQWEHQGEMQWHSSMIHLTYN